MIIQMQPKHAREVGKLHHRYVPSLLTDLGERACVTFYETALKSDNNFGLVYVENSKVLGFNFGTTDNSRLFKHPRILFGIGISALKKPLIIKKLLYRLIHKFPTGPEPSYNAVDLKLRGKGIGKKLQMAQLESFKKRGITQVIGWIEEDNKANLALQQKLGAKIVDEFYQNGKRTFILQMPTSLSKSRTKV
jgi:GNAT superfamily N-acetyltransferase